MDSSTQPPFDDDYLCRLATEARSYPQKSRERRRALAKLLRALEQSKQLARPRRGQFQGFYNDIYAEAVQRLFVYVCDRIDQYDSSKGTVLQWVNFLLTRRFFIEASREVLPTVPKGLDAKTITKIDVSELDRWVVEPNQSSASSSLTEELQSYLKADPNQVLQTTHVAKHPEANFQYLALKRLEGYSWQEISNELNLAISTLSSFYQRYLTQFAPIIYRDLS